MTTEIKENVSSMADAVNKTLNDKFASLADSQKTMQEQLDAILEKKNTEVAKVEDSGIATTMNKITDFEVAGIPVGAAIVGGAIAVFATEVIDGLLVKQSSMVRGAVKLGGAAVIMIYGKKVIGSKAAGAVALLMAFDAIKNDLLPQPFGYVTAGANKLTGVVTSAGLGWTGGPAKTGAVNQATRVARDYYATAEGK